MNNGAQYSIAEAQNSTTATVGVSAAGDIPATELTDLTRVRDNPFICARTLGFVLNFLEQEKGTLEDDDFFEFIVHILGDKAAMELAGCACSLEGLQAKTKMMLEASGDDTAPEVFSDLWSNRRTHAPLKKALLVALTQQRERWDSVAAQTRDQDLLRQRFEEMVRLFGLAQCESDLLLLAYVRYAGLWDWTAIGPNRAEGRQFQRVWLMARILGVGQDIVAKRLYESGRLRNLGCLDEELDFKPELESFLIGLSAEPLASKYFVRCTEAALPWAMYNKVVEQHGELLKQLIRRHGSDRGLNILFYGAPGTGKTSFARTLAAELGMELYRVRVLEEFKGDTGGARPRFAALRICDGQVNGNQSIILIDEADEMLGNSGRTVADLLSERSEGHTDKKDTLNTVLDELKTPCIWITNNPPGRLAPSARRRFDYSICFRPLSHQQRCQVWKNLVERYHLEKEIQQTAIDTLAGRFAISAGGVDMALRNFANLRGNIAAEGQDAEELLQRLLTPHCELLGIATDGQSVRAASQYALTGLKVRGRISPQHVLDAMRQFKKRREMPTAADERKADPSQLTVLLSGPPGTGKTEFVNFVGRELDLPVRTCMAGDLLSKFVGGTEENIRETFRAAQADNAVLFIDEADGLLRSRRFAERSWEVTQVNELLYALEHFRGILICATNFVETLDPATIRRFIFKLEFEFLDTTGKLAFYERMLAGLARSPLDESGRQRLGNIADLAPGDFHTVRQAMFYLGGDGGTATHEELLAALEQESFAKRQGKGGFGFGR